MRDKYVLMPCKCRDGKESSISLKSVSVIDISTSVVIVKVVCLFCHNVKRYKVGLSRFLELFYVHSGDIDENKL